MAIIESKGDGYSLFNGVKLPSLPEWDKATYPYALFYTAQNGTLFNLIASPVPYSYSTSYNNGVNEYAAVFLPEKTTKMIFQFKSGATSWSYRMTNANMANGLDVNTAPVGWSNHDIINIDDNSVYLAASEPISLDGMNVIEWDGDTEGLEQWDTQLYYLVSNKTDVDVEKHYHAVSLAVSTNKTTQKANMSFNTSQAYATASTFARYAGKAYVGSLAKGLYLGGKASGAKYTSLFAYYPIEPEQPEIDRGTLFLLYRIFSPDVFYAITGKEHWAE